MAIFQECSGKMPMGISRLAAGPLGLSSVNRRGRLKFPAPVFDFKITAPILRFVHLITSTLTHCAWLVRFCTRLAPERTKLAWLMTCRAVRGDGDYRKQDLKGPRLRSIYPGRSGWLLPNGFCELARRTLFGRGFFRSVGHLVIVPRRHLKLLVHQRVRNRFG
jgi:hypothetical protein